MCLPSFFAMSVRPLCNIVCSKLLPPEFLYLITAPTPMTLGTILTFHHGVAMQFAASASKLHLLSREDRHQIGLSNGISTELVIRESSNSVAIPMLNSGLCKFKLIVLVFTFFSNTNYGGGSPLALVPKIWGYSIAFHRRGRCRRPVNKTAR